jgi:hypothetical protein
MGMEVREIIAKIAILLFVALIIIALVGFLAWHEIGDEVLLHNGRFRYSLATEEDKWSVAVLDIVRERGKEPIYIVGFNGTKLKSNGHELSEADYKKYIGEGNNAITVKKSIINLWLSQNPFNDNLEDAWLYQAVRIQYPWSDPLVEFTDNDVKNLVAAFVADGASDMELPFAYDWWTKFDTRGISEKKQNSKEIP